MHLTDGDEVPVPEPADRDNKPKYIRKTAHNDI